MKLRSTQNYKPRKQDRETIKGKSLTVPDDSYTIREIIERSQNGFPVDIKADAGYPFENQDDFEADDIEAIQRMDLAEQHETLQRIRAKRQDLEEELKTKKSDKKAKELEQLKKEEESKKAEIEEISKKNASNQDKT